MEDALQSAEHRQGCDLFYNAENGLNGSLNRFWRLEGRDRRGCGGCSGGQRRGRPLVNGRLQAEPAGSAARRPMRQPVRWSKAGSLGNSRSEPAPPVLERISAPDAQSLASLPLTMRNDALRSYGSTPAVVTLRWLEEPW